MSRRHAAKPNARPSGETEGASVDAGISPVSEPVYQELLHFFNQSPDMLCIAGFDGKFRRLNPAWQQALGWTTEELCLRPFLDFVHPEDRPATLIEMEKLVIGMATITFENRYRCKDGSWKWMQWTARPLPEHEETYAIARDVTRQKLLEKEILVAQDRERERLGRELHDGHCQDLAGIAALSISLARRLSPAAAAEAAVAREIGNLLGRTIQHARDLARGMNPMHLKTAGLNAAIEDLCLKTGALFGITCRFHAAIDPLVIDPECDIHLYRIVQEAANNAITHGRAGCIDVHLVSDGGSGRLEIHDDGVGIADENAGYHPGIGLHTMSYRARLIGGSLNVVRGVPRGTVVRCVFPLAPANSSTKPHDPA